MRRHTVLLLLLSGVPAAAQDEVLALERRDDLRAHAVAVRLLQGSRADFRLEAASPREVCRLLAAATGDRLSFCCPSSATRTGAAITLELRHASLWSAMAAVAAQSGLRFVFRAGVVFLVPREEIRPQTHLVVYDLRPQTARLRSFPGPRLGLRGPGEDAVLFPPEEDSGQTVSGFTAEGIEALLREGVLPGHWDDEGVRLTSQNGLFLIRHTVQGHREIQRLLDRLGLLPLPRVVLSPARRGV